MAFVKMSSAGNTRGLIEASYHFCTVGSAAARVFRGEYPRPH